MLDAAIVAGVLGIFMAVAVPLVRGALIRHRTAECARKILVAAEAFDSVAAASGRYPSSGRVDGGPIPYRLRGAFERYDMDWWNRQTELGGHWGWYSNGTTPSVVISGEDLSERCMKRLDELLDDGNLETGAFLCRASRYHYVINTKVL